MQHWSRIIAIDGQAAAGKTVVGRTLARRLGYAFLDTGIMYRAIAWLALRESVPVSDDSALTALAETALMQLEDREGGTVRVNGEVLGVELRAPEVDDCVSLVARISGVRAALVSRQREIAEAASQDPGGIVMVGRDIGTVVLPDAGLKVFLVASPEVRASRRHRELVAQGKTVAYQEVLANALARDRIDSQREDSPLAQAADAHLIDTDNSSIDQVVDRILAKLDSPKEDRSR